MLNTLLILIAAFFLVAPSNAHAAYNDAEVDGAVERRLNRDPAVSADNVTVATREGVVTLQGTVRSLLEKERCAKIALSRTGVRSVINTLSVAAGPLSSKDIHANVEQTLAEIPALAKQSINVAVADSVVRLTGEVDLYDLIAMAGRAASSVYGVRGLENDLTLSRNTVNRTDDEIKSHIVRRFQTDIWLNDLFIEVAVKDGEVTLSGGVGSEQQRLRALSRVWVPGVRRVESEKLNLEDLANDWTLRKPGSGNQLNDEEIRATLEEALALHPWILSLKVDVSVNDRVVTLSGTVPRLPSKVAASRLAYNTVGVKQVSNQLLIKPDKALSDEDLARAVIEAWSRQTYTRGLRIKVSANDGVVTLTGLTPTSFERRQAAEVAAGVVGVQEINNKIVVDTIRRGYHPGELDEIMEPFPTEAEILKHLKSDAEIEAAIDDELRWNWFVQGDTVDVSVKAGVAKLQGTVRSERAMKAALRAAADGGAASMVNELKITPQID